jgi:CRP-like cAMP-binding protein
MDDFIKNYKTELIKKGKTLLSPGDKFDFIFFLEKGYIRRYIVTNTADELTIHVFEKGTFIELLDLFEEVDRDSYFDALTDLSVKKIPKVELLAFLQSNNEVSIEIIQRLLTGLDKISRRIKDMAYSSAKKRVANTLIFLQDHFGKSISGSRKIDEVFTHMDIAAFAGVSRETTSRELMKLRNKGAISIDDDKKIVIEDLESLENVRW